MYSNELFIDVECKQSCKHNKIVCGDVFLSRRIKDENRTLIVLADGLGSGIKANVLASLTANMIVNFMEQNQALVKFTEIIMDTLPMDQFRKIGYSTFTIIDIDADGETKIIEYGNPQVLIIRNGEFLHPNRKLLPLSREFKHPQELYYWEHQSQKEDRIFFMTDGITQSGIGRRDMPFGWEINGVKQFLKDTIHNKPNLSGRELCNILYQKAMQNDIQSAKDDISCGLVHFTKPKQLLICTGPPYKKDDDKLLAEKVKHFKGEIIISGGTTAQIVSRELQRDIEVDMQTATSQLPPLSQMEGVDVVSEGILTLGRISTLLEKLNTQEQLEDSPAGKIIQKFFDHDEIYILVVPK
jgi:serine/threonine protein phosphatase PrpC